MVQNKRIQLPVLRRCIVQESRQDGTCSIEGAKPLYKRNGLCTAKDPFSTDMCVGDLRMQGKDVTPKLL